MDVMFDTKELHLKFSFYAAITVAELNVSSGHVCMPVIWVEPSFTVMPLVVAKAWPHIDRIGYWLAVVMSLVCMSGWDGLLTDNCNTLRNVCEYTHTLTLSHTAAFYWNSWTSYIPAWKVNSCRLCCITHEGKTQQLLILQCFPEHTKLVTCKGMYVFMF